MVDPQCSRRGIGRALGEHCLAAASSAGFAVQLWKSLGFIIVGTLPKVFQHPHLGLVDAFVMYRFLP
jgi:ribosomal protein S18 acetylase RimI-like enzyme